MWVAEDLELVRIYYQRGNVKGSRLHYDIKDPPTSGWQNALIIGRSTKSKRQRCTIFCPYTLQSWAVRSDCAEITERRDIKHDHAEWEKLHNLLIKNWDEYQSLGMGKDYDTAVSVFKKMGVKAPEQKIKGGDVDTRRKGGKETGAELKKPVKLSSKRGKFLLWFLENGLSQSIRDTMAEFDMTRSNALSYLYMLQKDHGIGYELTGDTALVTLPSDCSNPFDVDWAPEGAEAAEEEDDDFSWMEEDETDAEDDDDSWLS